MYEQLERLQLDLAAYRGAVDQVVSSALTAPSDFQQCFLEISICASQLYLDYLLVTKTFQELDAVSSAVGDMNHVRADALREKRLREKLKHKLESSPSWNHFRAENPFSEITGLRSVQDYTERFTLHLPEIYEETFRAEIYIKEFLANHSASALSQMFVALQHLGRNHISFVLQALEWAADDGSWEESLVVSNGH
jgi:hypothetical protein